MKKRVLLWLAFFSCLQLGYSQAGQPDPSFGSKGVITADLGANKASSFGRQVLLKSDGSIYVISDFVYSSFYISKRLPNGSADSSFGNNGFSAVFNITPAYAAFAPDGKLVVAGRLLSNTEKFALARYNLNGSLDTTFSKAGIKTSDFAITSIDIQSDGKIVTVGSTVVNGYSYFALSRYNTDGSLDNSFGGNGKQTTHFGSSNDYAHSVAIQTDGKIIAVGYTINNDVSYFAISRYNADGSLDNSFSDDGKQITSFGTTSDIAYSLAIHSNGKIVVAGISNGYFALARYNKDGSLDKAFSDDGKQITPFAAGDNSINISSALALQSDGKIVVSGLNTLARYNTDGNLDSTFSKNGIERNYTTSLAIQSDGKIVVAGFDPDCVNDGSGDLACILQIALARYNSNGTLDKTFGKNGTLKDGLHNGQTNYTSTAIQKDGKIVAVGSTWNERNSVFAITRYNTDGSLDTSFSNDGVQTTDLGENSAASSVAIQSNGKIVVVGRTYSGFGLAFAVVRYNINGSLDSSFSGTGIQITNFNLSNDNANSVAIQHDEKIVVAGSSNADFAIARYNTDGSLDNTFSGDGKQTTNFSTVSSAAKSLALQKDGKIVLAGSSSAGRFHSISLVRYNFDGSPDNSFSGDGKQTTDFEGDYDNAQSVALQNDGKIVVGGSTSADNYGNINSVLARYNTDGSLDNTFIKNGIKQNHIEVSSISLQSDGKILMAGTDYGKGSFAIARYNTNGSLDSTFNSYGINRKVGVLSQIAIESNKLYAVGFSYTIGINTVGVVARYLLDGKSQTSPTVTLTSPSNNATYLAPAANIKLSATASDADGSISRVEFYNGNTLLHTETVSPYGFVWRKVPLGNYTLTAKAYDNSGLSTTSAPVHISVVPNKAPFISIIQPKNNRAFYAPGYIHFEADAKDVDGRITRVEFYNGSTLLNTQYQFPYTFTWEDLPIGTYTVTAIATDNWGTHTTSAPVTFIVIHSDTKIVSNKPSSLSKTPINNTSSLIVAPNPTTNVINIYTAGLQQNETATISVIAASGVAMKTTQSNSSTKAIEVDVSSLLSGVYTIRVISGNKILYKQFVKL